MSNHLMNKSEVKDSNFKPKEGWICPRCGKVLSPTITQCNCTKTLQESSQSEVKWIKD